MKNHIDQAEQYLLHTYNRYPIIWDHGEGVYLYDLNGKRYLDFVSGIGVFALGYGDSAYNQAIKSQIDKITHTSNYYYNMPAMEAARRLTEVSGLDRVFFANSGAEAVEGAIKAARKYAYLKDGHTGHDIIALNRSFHGRTMGALSVTGTPKYREAFEPMIGHVQFADMNDFDSILACVSDRTCAILIETVQGEGGIYPAEEAFLKQIRKLCDEKDILFILDEIQCGMGRTGTMFAWQKFGVKPDIMTTAKALGCGVPVGAFLLTERVAEHSLQAGDHGTTYGGNPLAAAAINIVLELFGEKQVLQHVNEVTPHLEACLDSIVRKHDYAVARRGSGLLQGVECRGPVGGIIEKALDRGLVLINAGPNIIRFIPPLIITAEQVEEMSAIVEQCITDEESL